MTYTVTITNKGGYSTYTNFLTEAGAEDYFSKQCKLLAKHQPEFSTRVKLTQDGDFLAEETFEGKSIGIVLTREEWKMIRLALISSESACKENKEMVFSLFDNICEKVENDTSWY